MFLELKKDLESSVSSSAPSYIDAPAMRSRGKVFFRNRELHDFSCFDILGLAQNARVRRAAQESIETIGVSSCSSRKNAGTSDQHLLCEKALAGFFGYEKALLFSSKNQAVFTLLATLLREQDLVFCDSDYAGLLSDVCLLLNCSLEIVDLTRLTELENLISTPSPFRRKIVFADSVANSSARKLDLTLLSAICSRQQALLINDESLASGILGPRGAGSADDSQISAPTSRPYCLISDLGLGLGCYGACLSGPALLVEAIAARSKTIATETSFPPHLAAAILTAVDVCELSIAQRALVSGKREYIYSSLSKIEQRIRIKASSFVSMEFKKWTEANAFLEFLLAKGFFCELIQSSSRLSDSAFIRIVPSYFHTDETIAELITLVELFFSKSRD